MDYELQRKRLVERLERVGYLKSDKVKQAMLELPRELFLPKNKKDHAYVDNPVSTFEGQTISAPHMNALMCEYLDLEPGQKLLDIGTGSGYHAALCAQIVCKKNSNNRKGHVYSIERIEKLVEFAQENLKKAGLENDVTAILADGTLGYPKYAPYDRILVAAAGPKIPEPLVDQLKVGGKLCIPIGAQRTTQKLFVVTKTESGYDQEEVCKVVFVPLVGEHGY
ncbi:MAG: protein-L-isoaspartate(D-aspartate) O-methyltransferase [archaeon]|nr:protein-L-isoaspartate(D-aspartate) O-methyltransferase [archaeon]